jgi:hypothetical protein
LKKMCWFVALILFVSKKKQLCRRNFFNSSLFSSGKLNLKIQFKFKRSILFFPSLFSHALLWWRIIEFSIWVFSKKKGLNWKIFFYKVVSFFDTNKIGAKTNKFFSCNKPISSKRQNLQKVILKIYFKNNRLKIIEEE